MLELTNVNSFDFMTAAISLHAVCLDIAIGDKQVTAVLGRNGTGKTTLLKTLMGLTDPHGSRPARSSSRRQGYRTEQPTFRRACAGISLRAAGPRDHSRFHHPGEYPDGRVRPRETASSQIPDLVPEPVSLSDGQSEPARRQVLSVGGQQQQLAIARALAADPEDHPARRAQRGHPARRSSRKSKRSSFASIRSVGLTIILVEQNVAFARQASHVASP